MAGKSPHPKLMAPRYKIKSRSREGQGEICHVENHNNPVRNATTACGDQHSLANKESCPARGQDISLKCGIKNHFANKCRQKGLNVKAIDETEMYQTNEISAVELTIDHDD